MVTVPTPAPKVAEAPKVAGEASEKMPIPDITSEAGRHPGVFHQKSWSKSTGFEFLM